MKRVLYLLALALPVIFLTGCEDEDTHGLTAVAGPDQQVSVGETVTLSGASSMDQTGDGFTAMWSFVSTPEGSNATLTDPQAITTTFTPDVEGDYRINLTISNASGQSSDELTVSAIAAGTMEISGSYSDDLHLLNLIGDPNVPDYIVTGNLTINARLTIDPRVRIHVASDALIRLNSNAVLTANGTEEEPIIITGTTELPGFWRGILLSSSNLENSMEHVHISATGSSPLAAGNPRSALHLSSARLSISHSSFTGNEGFGVSASSSSSRLPMTNNYFDLNQQGAMQIHAAQIRDIDTETNFNGGEVHITSGNLNENAEHTWKPLLNGNYRFTANVTFNDAVNIEPGAEFALENDVLLRFHSSSVLRAIGTAADPITFRGTLQQAGSWRGLLIESADLNNLIEHVHFMHAGHSNLMAGYGRAALGLSSSARVNIEHSQFSDVNGYGIYVNGSGASFTFDNNSFGGGLSTGAIRMFNTQIHMLDAVSDFGGNYAEIDGGNLGENLTVTWPALNNGSYLFTGNSNINGNVTIDAGAILEFENDIVIRFRGVIIADGNASQHIVFTRKSGSSAHWRGMSIETSSLENLMNYVEVSYAGNNNLMAGYGPTNIGMASNARLTLTNSTISNSLGYGIYLRSGAELNEVGNTFSNNALGNTNED